MCVLFANMYSKLLQWFSHWLWNICFRAEGWMQGCYKSGKHQPNLCLAPYLTFYHSTPYLTWPSIIPYLIYLVIYHTLAIISYLPVCTVYPKQWYSWLNTQVRIHFKLEDTNFTFVPWRIVITDLPWWRGQPLSGFADDAKSYFSYDGRHVFCQFGTFRYLPHCFDGTKRLIKG